MKNRRGVSGVVVTVLLIALVVIVVAVVWAVVVNLVQDNIQGSESCFGNFNKIELNGLYTCYDSSAGELQFSISIGDVELDKIIVFVSGSGSTKSIELSDVASTESAITPYGGAGEVKMPGSNAGKTYVLNLATAGIVGEPDLIRISPVISGNQCETSDSISRFEACATSA
jgi:hypothetical protein